MSDTITSIQDVRVGDIFLGPIGGAVGLGVGLGELIVDGGFRIGELDVRHAGIVTTAEPGVRYNVRGFDHGVQDHFELTQAMPSGAETVTMTYADHWTPRCAYVRLPEDYLGQAEEAAQIAKLMVTHEVGYSYGSYAALAAWHWGWHTARLEAWINRRQEPIMIDTRAPLTGGRRGIMLPREAICSVLVDQAWSLAGKRVVTGAAHQAVTPSMLAQALMSTEGVTWGWPGRHPYTPVL